MATWVALIVVYGLLVAIGGIIGYQKARSKVSLISGLVSGGALAIAAYLTVQTPTQGLTLAAVIAAVLFIVFAIRWVKTRAIMPAGMMTVLSLAGAIAFGYAAAAINVSTS